MTNSQHLQLFFFHRVLSSAEVLSTDEESSDSGEESDEELGRALPGVTTVQQEDSHEAHPQARGD